MKQKLTYLTAVVLGLFALLTLFLSSSVLFDLFNIRQKEGNYVLPVVWANFISSIIYLVAVVGLLKANKWTPLILLFSAMILSEAFVALKVHINHGGIYELKTVTAMIFRIVVTLVFTAVTFYLTKKETTIIL